MDFDQKMNLKPIVIMRPQMIRNYSSVIGMKSALVYFIAVNNKVTESSIVIINPAFLHLQFKMFPEKLTNGIGIVRTLNKP